MSDEVLAPILAILILGALFLWVPTLHVCNDRCQKLLRGRTKQQAEEAAGESAKPSIAA